MNPKEFDWKEDQQVTVTNPTKADYKFLVHSKEYIVPAGQTAKMPGYIAWVYVYGLASQMAQADNNFLHWNEEGFRKTYFDKVVAGKEDVVQAVVPEPTVEPVEFTAEDEDEPLDEPAEEPKIAPMKKKTKKKK